MSYPFCAQKCTYCNFASGVLPRGPRTAISRRAPRRNSRDPVDLDARDRLPRRRHPQHPGSPNLAKTLLNAIPGKPWKKPLSKSRPAPSPPKRSLPGRDAGHQPRQPRRPVFHRTGTPPHRTQAHRRDRRLRHRPATCGRHHRIHQHRPHRRTLRPDRRILGALPRLD